eukprot:5839163-Pleurochrysis_carterae.AAC.1
MSLASRIVVCTQTSVVIPPMIRRFTPHVRSRWSRSVPQKQPLPGLSIMSSVGRGDSSGINSQPGSPRVSTRPCAPREPISAPIEADLHRLFSGKSASDGRWPSRVWITLIPAARAEARRFWSGVMGARTCESERRARDRSLASVFF